MIERNNKVFKVSSKKRRVKEKVGVEEWDCKVVVFEPIANEDQEDGRVFVIMSFMIKERGY